VLGLAALAAPRRAARVHRARSVVQLGSALVVALACSAPWLAIRGAIPSIDEDYPRVLLSLFGLAPTPEGAGVTNQIPRDLNEALARLPVVLAGFGTMAVQLLRWNLLWFLFVAAPLVWCAKHPRTCLRHGAWPAALCVAGAFGLYTLVLVTTPWNLSMLFNTLIPDRLMLHVAPLAILAGVQFSFPLDGERGSPPDADGPPDAAAEPTAGARAPAEDA
jgi:4-amino-4-deoxy-L-arabinose transferase-like glycosyltransferase